MKHNLDMELEIYDYNIPKACTICGGVMVYKGVGEYQCEDCKELDYDDYGKTRLYIETHKGATTTEIEAATGVKQRTIRAMLKEGRFELRADSKTFLSCEICKKAIRFGRLCPECEINYHRKLEDRERRERQEGMRGYGKSKGEATGAKRFKREQ